MKRNAFIFYSFVIAFGVLITVACTKDRIEKLAEDQVPVPTDSTISEHYLFINEFIAKGSQNPNEYGTNEDWIEIYNPHATAVTLAENSWYISDAGTAIPDKYLLPSITIPAHGFLVVWCDGLSTIDTQIHTSFNLSAAGEDLVLYYKPENASEGVVIDQHAYISQGDGISEGRYPDGGNTWTNFNVPTINASNN